MDDSQEINGIATWLRHLLLSFILPQQAHEFGLDGIGSSKHDTHVLRPAVCAVGGYFLNPLVQYQDIMDVSESSKNVAFPLLLFGKGEGQAARVALASLLGKRKGTSVWINVSFPPVSVPPLPGRTPTAAAEQNHAQEVKDAVNSPAAIRPSEAGGNTITVGI